MGRQKGPFRHGTPTGFRQHQLLDEEPCDPCKLAKAEYDHNWRLQPIQVKKNRAHASAQARAKTVLSTKYREEYLALYEKFKAEAYRERGITDA